MREEISDLITQVCKKGGQGFDLAEMASMTLSVNRRFFICSASLPSWTAQAGS